MEKLEKLEAQLKELEKGSRKLEPDHLERETLLEKAGNYIHTFIDEIEQLPAYESKPEKGAGILDYPIEDKGIPFDEILDAISKNIDHAGLNPASGGHLGYIPGGGIFPAAIGDLLAAAFNRYAGIFYASPGAVRLENMLIRWMCDLFGYPASAHGNLTTGGSLANLIGIVTARDAKNITCHKIPTSVIYLSEQVHHSVDKAIRIAGLGEAMVRKLPLDEFYRIDAHQLKDLVKEDIEKGLNPFLIIASVGTTNTGSVDPVDAIAEIAQENNCWFHVDAAYGGFFILSDLVNKKLKGIEKADSIVVDPHKGLFLPYGLGFVLVKEQQYLQQSHYYFASYLQDVQSSNEEVSPADLSPELTKHFRGLRLWIPLKLFGLQPFKDALDEKILLCRYFYQKLSEIENMETGPYPDLSVMIYRYLPENEDANEFNKKLLEAVVRDGRVFLSSTMLDGKYYLRLAVLAFRTHKQTIDLCIDVLNEKIEILKKSE